MKLKFLSLLGATFAVVLSSSAVLAQEAGQQPPEIQLSPEGKKILCEKFPLNSRCPGGQPLTGVPTGTEAAPAPDATMPSEPGTAPDATMPSDPGAAPDTTMPSDPGAAPDATMPSDPGAAPAPDTTMPADPGTAPPPDGSAPTTPGTEPSFPGSPGMGQ